MGRGGKEIGGGKREEMGGKREICDVKSFILYDPLPFGTLAEKRFFPILHQIENEM